MRSRLVLLVLVSTMLSAGCAGVLLTAGPPPAPGAQSPSGSFGVVCGYSHRATDDPIVHFGMPTMSHSHDFFGNTSTNAASTVASMSLGSSTCNRSADKSAYWVPTVFYQNAPVTPTKVQVYYNNDRRSDIRTLPKGLKIVAGDAHATGPQSTREVAWQCSDGNGPQASLSLPPQCQAGTTLKMIIRFPGCWDGVNLDSPDHKSHMAYAQGNTRDGECPPGFPVKVPSVNAEFKYPISDGAGVTLSSGPAYTLHGDFFNAWDPATLQSLVNTCVDAGVKCKG